MRKPTETKLNNTNIRSRRSSKVKLLHAKAADCCRKRARTSGHHQQDNKNRREGTIPFKVL